MLYYLLCLLLFANAESIYRLSTEIRPISYNITLYPNFDENISYDFEGWEYITINISVDYVSSNDDPFQIRIHQGTEVEMTNISIILQDIAYIATTSDNNTDTEITNISFSITNNEVLSLIDSNRYIIAILYMKYTSMYRTRNGLFVSSYTYNNISIRNIVTQFESVFARTAFPCFDEPALKAIFEFTLIAPINATVLYNTPILNTNIDTNGNYSCYYEYSNGNNDRECKIVRFEVSPIMSTYLNTFVIGDYQKIDGINPYFLPNNVSQNLYYPWNRAITDAEWAYNTSLLTVYYFGSEQLFNYSYIDMLSKLDDIAITDRSNAMEHWGLVTYDTGRLMTNPLIANLEEKIRCSLVIGHELAHQWFGNLVTCKWWSNIFINEGFGRYLEYWSADTIHPELNVYDYRALRTNNQMNDDVTKYTHPIIMDEELIQTPQECINMFDNIAYDKGASILKMIDNFMGRQVFLKASKEFLNIYQYDNANSDDLIQVFTSYYNGYSGPTDFTEFFNSWLKLSGFPVLNVIINYDEEEEDDMISVIVSQSRMIKRNVNNNNIYDELWYIPLIIMTSVPEIEHKMGTFNEGNYTFMIDRIINESNKAEYYLFNIELINHFRTSYDSYSMDLIISNFEYISFWAQYNFIADYSALMEYSYISGEIYLDLLYRINDRISIENQHREELSYQLWQIIIESLYNIDNKLCQSADNSTPNLLHNFHQFARDLLNPVYKDVNEWNENETDSEHILKLRNDVILALIRFQDENVIDFGYNLLLELMNENDGIIPLTSDGYIDISSNDRITSNLITPILKASLAVIDYNMLNNLLSIFSNCNNQQQIDILQCFEVLYKDNNLTETAYNFILDHVDDSLKVQGFNYLSTCSNIEGIWNKLEYGGVWDFLYVNGLSINLLIEIPINFASQENEEKITTFYYNKDNVMNDYGDTVNSTLEQIGSNIVWLTENEENMNKYLQDYIDNKLSNDTQQLKAWEIVLIVVALILFLLIVCLIISCCIRIRRKKEKKRYQQMGYESTDLVKYGAAAQ